jgi:hypothetical protein
MKINLTICLFAVLLFSCKKDDNPVPILIPTISSLSPTLGGYNTLLTILLITNIQFTLSELNSIKGIHKDMKLI